MLLALVSFAAAFAAPSGDRPAFSPSAFLVRPRSLEVEIGGWWQEGFTVPARVKYGVGRSFEPSIGLDLSGVDEGDPNLSVQGKFRLLVEGEHALSALVRSGFPVADDDRWSGLLAILYTAGLPTLDLRATAGLDLGSSGNVGVAYTGVPLTLLVGTPFTSSLSGFVEGATVIDAGFRDWQAQGGLLWKVTGILVLDAAGGWDFGTRDPFATLGLTANLGTLGG
ncbi:MAG: hypothetical protein JXB39_16340 [Deltaproteobacteria bacterium]|nr:hypothetical protein [Deltaproteobacteria bacterium]